IGIISYSYRALPADQILPGIVKAGLSEVELMSNHAEVLMGAPSVGRAPGGKAPDPDAVEALRKGRMSLSASSLSSLGKKFDEAGVDIRLLCYNLSSNVTDDEIEYSFQMAKGLGVKAISCSTQIPVARRVAPFADKHKMMWGAHGHDQKERPEE